MVSKKHGVIFTAQQIEQEKKIWSSLSINYWSSPNLLRCI